MTGNIQNCFSFNFKSVLIDEIALNGLEGIGLDYLWKRVEKRLTCTLTPKIISKFWAFITSTKYISFYKLQSPVPKLEIQDRFTIVDKETGQLLDPPEAIDGPYEYNPIENEYGSCTSYKTRALIPHEFISVKPYEETVNLYGDTLVMVASLEERWQALAPHLPISLLPLLTPIHYCILELVGKGRENGQMTVGNTNLNKIVKESKLLFYNRKHLQKLDLVRVQCVTQIVGEKGMKSIILRLKRFHEPSIMSQPKVGKIHTITEYLLQQPGYTEKNEVMIRRGFMTPHQSKRLQKTVNIFKFEEKEEKKKKYITLLSQSDESSHSEDDTPETPLKCQYKVGISLLRQAYERFVDAGLNGLTQIEVAQLLGIEFYTSRTICRIFKTKGIVREFLEDKGRQRTARYIAVAATNEIDNKYAEEKKKLMDYFSKSRKRCHTETTSEVPEKRQKQETQNKSDEVVDDLSKRITEVKVLDGFQDRDIESLLNTKKKPTLRQLKFATGILKVVKERGFVTGYQTLSSFVSTETGEPPMDTKSLKLVLQKLITGHQLKVFKFRVTCPDKERFSLFICPPYVKPSDSIVKKHYNELCLKAQLNYKDPLKKLCQNVTRPLTRFTYPRYLKIQKLHEHIMKIVYFSDVKSSFAPGFTSLYDIIPEMSVEFALGNITFVSDHNVSNLKVNDNILEQKLRDAPDNIRNIILNSKSLHNSIRTGLKMLAILGLIQLIRDPSSCAVDENVYLNFVFYVNQRAKILDTSGIWPRANDSALEKSFHFKSCDDVNRYWEDVQSISLGTTVTGVKRDRYKFLHPLRNEQEVLQFDNGTRFGDGLGPCGFNSAIFMDIPRLWRTYSSRNMNPRVVKILKSKIKYKKGCKSGPKEKAKKKVLKKKVKNNAKVKPASTPNPVEIKVSERISKNETSVKWTKLDDHVLTMLKIAVAIMGPVPGSIKVRNAVAKSLLSPMGPGKIASLCHRRSTHLESNPELAHEKLCILNELRRHPNLIEKYDGLFKVLRIRHYANLPKFIKEAKLPMMELLWIINQVAKTKPYIQHMPCVARNLEEFYKNYTITASTVHKMHSLYRTPTTAEPEFAVLKEGIILTIMLSLDTEITDEISKSIYSVFKLLPEYNLRSAIEELRKSGAIAAREKIFNSQLHKVHLNDIIQSSYKISFAYKRRWMNRLCSQFDKNIADFMEKELPKHGLKGSTVVNCLLLEMQSCELLDIVSVTVPVIMGSAGSLIQEEKMNIIDMEAKYKLKSGLVGWKNLSNMKTFSELYQNLDFEEPFEILARNSVVTFEMDFKDDDDQDEIIQHLQTKDKYGSSLSELQNVTGMDRKTLYEKLKQLDTNEIIKRVGYYDNRVVLKKYAKPWLFQIETNKYVIPTPWVTLDAQIRRNVFMNWASVIMNKIFECPGSSIEFLSKIFEFITVRSVQDVCMFLEKCECIELKCIQTKEADLFSDDDVEPELIDYNCYESPSNIVTFPLKNSLTKFSYLKHRILKTVKQ